MAGPGPGTGHCARRRGGGGPPSSSQPGLPRDPRAPRGPTARPAPPSSAPSPPPLSPSPAPLRLGGQEDPREGGAGPPPLYPAPALPADTCGAPRTGLRSAAAGGPTPQQGRCLGRPRRAWRLGPICLPVAPTPFPSSSGIPLWVSNVTAPCAGRPGFGAQGAPAGWGWGPRGPRSTCPCWKSRAPRLRHSVRNLSACQGPLALNCVILPQTAIVLAADPVPSSGLSVLYSTNKFVKID
ncbi:translation initiation factor IF-2-like [Zalophus californianus]|uniref:Translation initiation factor IF-2-like n=1 Tax=Zalophus californianus TaxID=9704 RepID=A0A6J2EVK2_ZALCA|nr:translation initiation factor IF-2-like [Zalophus californianus]